MSRSPLHVSAAVALLAGAAVAPAALAAQQLPVRTMSRPAAEFAEPYSAVRGVRELADGRLIVTDNRDKVVQLVDLRTGRATTLGREGSGPNEYQMPMAVLPLPGDSTMVADALNARFLLLGPGGTLAGTWAPATAEAGGAGGDRAPRTVVGGPPAGGVAGGRAPQGAVMSFGGGGPMQIIGARATDAQGRLYMTGAPIAMTPEGPKAADSVPVLRVNRRTMVTDTMAWLRPPRGNTNVNASGGNMSIRIGGGPFAADDGWTVLPDGRVVVVRHTDYHVEVYPATPKGTPVRGTPVRATPLRVTEAEKKAWREERASSAPVAIAMTRTDGPGGSSTRTAPASLAQQEPDSWPEVMPFFQSGQVYTAPDGSIWVGRYRSASDKTPRYDVFDATGKHTGQVVFPARTRIVGFGKGTVYTVRADEDDLQYVQKWTL